MSFRKQFVNNSQPERYDLSRWSKQLIMGEAKRRKDALGDKYGQEANIFPWLPITKSQSEQFVKWSTKGAWIGIGFLVVYWLTVRLIGPAFGWWQVN